MLTTKPVKEMSTTEIALLLNQLVDELNRRVGWKLTLNVLTQALITE